LFTSVAYGSLMWQSVALRVTLALELSFFKNYHFHFQKSCNSALIKR